jgi:hypothetical protein
MAAEIEVRSLLSRNCSTIKYVARSLYCNAKSLKQSSSGKQPSKQASIRLACLQTYIECLA